MHAWLVVAAGNARLSLQWRAANGGSVCCLFIKGQMVLFHLNARQAQALLVHMLPFRNSLHLTTAVLPI
jgi:hypothetical protein